jgi:hypothetical protein
MTRFKPCTTFSVAAIAWLAISAPWAQAAVVYAKLPTDHSFETSIQHTAQPTLADGWQWADALNGPTPGTERDDAHHSLGALCGDGGPQCGARIGPHTDFAFGIHGVPEPSSLVLAALGLDIVPWRRIARNVQMARQARK